MTEPSLYDMQAATSPKPLGNITERLEARLTEMLIAPTTVGRIIRDPTIVALLEEKQQLEDLLKQQGDLWKTIYELEARIPK